jgi:hypothetical protein
MFEALIWLGVVVVALGMWYAYAGSRDVFHPLMFIGPMMLFMYAWMPWKLNNSGGLEGFFQTDQLIFVQGINVAGMLCFVLGCLSIGCRLPASPPAEPMSARAARALVVVALIIGLIGFAAWAKTILEVGGLRAAFSTSYQGGWDDNGYVRDGALLMFPAFLLILATAIRLGFKLSYLGMLLLFIGPWSMQALFTARRGPTFMIFIMIAMGWYLNHRTRPSLIATGAAGLLLGVGLMFLVINRGNIYMGSDQQLTTDVSGIADKADTGNEYIYGTGAILSAEQRHSFYWGRRYMAQIVVRPIPHTIWPDKYADFGLNEMLHNGGTGEGFAETLGWEGADGSAPGIIADLWLEFRWLNFPFLFLMGQLYARAWRRTHTHGGPWVTEYILMSALSIYFVMQTMEAVIFRLLILSIPVWIAWFFAGRRETQMSFDQDSGFAPQLSSAVR